MISRLQAASYIRAGIPVFLYFTGIEQVNGRNHTYSVTLRVSFPFRRYPKRGMFFAVIDCHAMRNTYSVNITRAQLLAYIRRHYPRRVFIHAAPISFRAA